MLLFITIRFLDVLDILLVAFLLYQVYRLSRGTVAIGIFTSVVMMYMFWFVVKALDMHLLSSILGQVMGVGVIALLIVFQQEIRRFLLIMGNKYFSSTKFNVRTLFSFETKKNTQVQIYSIMKACAAMSEVKTGALIVIARKSMMGEYVDTGDIIDAKTSSRLLISIFNKYSPLHDGAVIINNDTIHAARCVLPASEKKNLPANLGLRHRAAIGLTEVTDAFVVVVSEETGNISVVEDGVIKEGIEVQELINVLEANFTQENDASK